MNPKNKILRIIQMVLGVWGAISLIGIIAIGGYILYSIGPGNQNVDDQATNSDVRFVLNWCNLGDQRIERVIHSHVSARSFNSDHLDAYEIKINGVTIDELTLAKTGSGTQWYRGDDLPKILDDALTLVDSWPSEVPWFPKEADIRTPDFYIYPWSIDCHGIAPRGAKLIIVKPAEKMVYYISTSM